MNSVSAAVICALLFAAPLAAAVYYDQTPAEKAAYAAPLPAYARWRAVSLDAPTAPPVLVDVHSWDFAGGGLGGLQYDGGIANVQVRDGKLSFDVTAPGRLWYGYAGPGRKRAEELDLGRSWPTMMYAPTIQVRLKQSLPRSEGAFTTINERTPGSDTSRQPFQLQGADWQVLQVTGAEERTHAPFRCLMLELTTPGNHVEIEWVKAGRLEQRRYLRTTLDLPAAPRSAIFNLNGGEYELLVNGQPAYSYHYFMGERLVRPVDCTKLLHPGRNSLGLIVFGGTVALQGQVLLADGRSVPVQTDDTWKASAHAPDGWSDPSFDASAWSKPQLHGSPDVPAPYDGPISLTPTPARPSAPSVPELSSETPPIFDFAEGARFLLRLPTQRRAPQTEYRVRYEFADPWTHDSVAAGEVTDFRPEGLDQVARLDRKLPQPGAYDLTVQWLSGGQVLATRHEEILLIGPVPQARVPESGVEAALKLKLVDEIDCTNPADPHPRLTISGGYRKSPAPFAVRVTTSPAGKYLESETAAAGDCVRYVVTIPHPYKWYIIEFQYPDDANRVMTFGFEDRHWDEDHAVPWQRTDGGPHTGWGLPTTGKMQTWRVPVLPGKHKASLYVANCKDGDHLAIARIRVYEVTGELPDVVAAHDEPGRNFGIHEERPLAIYSYASFPGWDRWVRDDAYMPYPGNYARWYRTYENYIRYLRYAGRNYVQMDLYMYGDYSQPSWPAHYKGNDYFNYPYFDYVTPMLRMFEANGIKCTLAFEFTSAYRLHGFGRDDYTDEEVAAGAPTSALVDKNGHQVSWWCGFERDPLQPQVQKAMTDYLDDLLSRYARYSCVKAVSFLEGGAWGPCFAPQDGQPGDWLASGYGDFDIAKFTKDTGITIPVSASDPQRFAKRYAWLKAHAYEPWVTWRCRQIKQVNDLLRDHVRRARSDLLFAPLFGEFNHAPYLELAHRETGESYLQLLRESGRDPRLYVGQPGYLSYGELFAADRARSATMHQQSIDDYGAARSSYLAPDLAALFANGSHTGLFNFEAFYEQGISLPENTDWLFRSGDSLACYSLGSGDFIRDRLVSSLWHWDPAYLAFVWCDCYQFMGNEKNLRRFSLAFRSLPLGHYTLLAGAGRDRNVVIKHLAGRPLWAVLNPSPWPLRVELTASPGAVLRNRLTDQPLPRAGSAAILELRPCDLAVVEATGAATLLAARAVTSPEALAYLQTRAADYHALLDKARPRAEEVGKETLDALAASAGRLDAYLREGDLLSAWLLLETWDGRRPYVMATRALADSNWRVLGPFPFAATGEPLDADYGPERDLLAGKDLATAYPTATGATLHWRFLQVPDNPDGRQTMDFVSQWGECPNSVAYAYSRLTSPRAQRVRFQLGSDDGVKVWLNGQMIHEHEIQRGVRIGDDTFEADLRPGDNMLLLKVDQYVGGWGVAFRLETLEGQPVTDLTYHAR